MPDSSGPVRAVVFDLFDTLVDEAPERLPHVLVRGRRVPSTLGMLHAVIAESCDADLDTLAGALREVDAEHLRPRYREGIEWPTQLRFERLAERLGIRDPALPERLTETHMGGIRSVTDPVPHHAAVLSSLRARYRLGVCSNFSHAATARAVLDEAALSPHFESIVISEDLGLRKPRAEIFREVATQLGVDPGQSVHVGDNLRTDVAGAAALGMRTVWITRRVRDVGAARRDYDGPAPTWTISDLAELPELLSSDDGLS